MISEGSIEIDRPIEQVFEYTNNNVADWSITVVEEEILEEQPGHVGTRFRCVTQERGNRMEFQGVITAWEPPTRSVIEMVGDHFDLEVEYLFEDLAGTRTRVTQRSHIHPKGFLMKAFFACCGWMMSKSTCKSLEAELNSLKQKLES
jgi:uncharacterized membrane protein